MFTTEVENFPGFPEGVDGQDLMARMKAQAERYGTRIVQDDVVEVDFSAEPKKLRTSYSGEFLAKAVIVATGARANWLGPGERDPPGSVRRGRLGLRGL